MLGELLPNGRRNVTVLFCDLGGLERYHLELGDTGVAELLQSFYNAVGQAVLEHYGVIDKLIADCVMAHFNAVRKVPDHQKRAAAAASSIHQVVGNLKLNGFDTKVRISLATGPVEVVTFRCGSHSATTVIGEPVNRAARELLPIRSEDN